MNGAIDDLKVTIPLNFANSQVTIVDINSAVDPIYDLVADGVHPSPSGETAITNRLFSAMKNYYNW